MSFRSIRILHCDLAIGYAQDEHEHEHEHGGHGWIGVSSIEEHEEHEGHEDHEDHEDHKDHRRLRNWKGSKEEEEHEHEPAHTIQLYKSGEDWAEDSLLYVYCVKVSTADFEGLEEGEELFEE